MSVIISVFYPLWYQSRRARIKDIVDISNYNTARTELQNVITEHNSWLTQLGNPKDGIYGENIMMQHALNHLNAVINGNDPSFVDDNGETKHHSDIVKDALLRTPKQQY